MTCAVTEAPTWSCRSGGLCEIADVLFIFRPLSCLPLLCTQLEQGFQLDQRGSYLSFTAMEAASLSYADTVYSADAVEFCPGRPHLFACGTYQVVQDEASANPATPAAADPNEDEEEAAIASTSPDFTRYGRCLLYEVDRGGRNLYVDPHTTRYCCSNE